MPISHRPARGKRQLADVLVARFTRMALALAAAATLFVQAPVTHVAASQSNCTVEQGQALIDTAKYDKAIQAFTCVVDAGPSEVEGYRGRIEAEILLGRYSDAVIDYQRVMAFVVPVDPGAEAKVIDGYAARLASNPTDVRALTGMSFAQWWFFHYAEAIQVTDRLLSIRPNDPFGTLFRGSARLLKGVTKAKGVVDLDRAIALAPTSPDVRVIVADAYTYGLPDPERAFAEASLALEWGLDTPRVHAILATSYTAFGDVEAAALHIHRSIELVTTEVVPTAPLAVGASMSLGLVPGRVYAMPIAATQGETISIETSSPTIWDSIAVLLTPDGTPVVGSDDTNAYMAAFDWVATDSTTYTLLVTSFEAVFTGTLVVTR
jgi:tetratricopeptide (TPR) repeat protein